MTVTKRKLTLSVDAQTIDAAKKSGINISELTEQILRVVGEEPPGKAPEFPTGEYRPLLEALKPVAHAQRTNIPVGVVFAFDYGFKKGDFIDPRETVKVWLTQSGQLGRSSFDDFEWDATGPEQWADNTLLLKEDEIKNVHFDSPMEIVKNTLNAISQAREERRVKRQSVALALQFVDVLAKNDDERTSGPPRGGNKAARRRPRSSAQRRSTRSTRRT